MKLIDHNSRWLPQTANRCETFGKSRMIGSQGQRDQDRRRVVNSLLLTLLLCVAGSGCLPTRGLFSPFPLPASSRPCQLPPNLTKSELVQHLNDNIDRLGAWRSSAVEVHARGMPAKLSAVIAVERARNFRLRAKSLIADEADLGSNNERFWFWMRRNPQKYVFTADHNQLHTVQQMMRIPFQPNWLMEVLGVVRIDESQFVMQPETSNEGIVSLVSDRVSPAGHRVRRVIRVDTCRGHVVAHELYDDRNRLIARAKLNDYQRDVSNGVLLPHRIHLDWPQTATTMTLTIGTIEVNPTFMPEQMWQPPKIRGYPVFDLGLALNSPLNSGQTGLNFSANGEGDARTTVRPMAGDVSPPSVENRVAAGVPTRDTETSGWHAHGGAEWPLDSAAVVATDADTTPPFDDEPDRDDELAGPPWDEALTPDRTTSNDFRGRQTRAPVGFSLSGRSVPSTEEEPLWDTKTSTAPRKTRRSNWVNLISGPFRQSRRGSQ